VNFVKFEFVKGLLNDQFELQLPKNLLVLSNIRKKLLLFSEAISKNEHLRKSTTYKIC
jgi:hypothetical protein